MASCQIVQEWPKGAQACPFFEGWGFEPMLAMLALLSFLRSGHIQKENLFGIRRSGPELVGFTPSAVPRERTCGFVLLARGKGKGEGSVEPRMPEAGVIGGR